MSRRTARTIQQYLLSGASVTTRRNSEVMVLRKSAKASVVLRDERGTLTNAGKAYETLTGRALPGGGFLDQQLKRKGNTEYLKLRNGKLSATRRFNGDEWKFTKLGKRYYTTITSSYVAKVPVHIIGKRKNGTTYRLLTHLPIFEA